MMPIWLAGVLVVAAAGTSALWWHYVGYKQGQRLTPKDHELRDLVRQRDKMMRERDEANAAANKMAAYGMQMEAEALRLRDMLPHLRGGRPN